MFREYVGNRLKVKCIWIFGVLLFGEGDGKWRQRLF